MENIGLQDSLLSRFDLLFIVLDKMDPENDRMISDHVLQIHRYRNPGEQDGEALPFGSAVDVLTTRDPATVEDENEETPIYEKHDNLLHGNRSRRSQQLVSMKFMCKYIAVAKDVKPVLTRDAADYIADEYAKLRNQDNMSANNIAKMQPMTAQTLETMIHLSTAHAKARLSKTVDLVDAESVVELVEFAFFKKVLRRERRRKLDDSESEVEEELETEIPRKKRKSKKEHQRKPRDSSGEGYDSYDFDSEGIEDVEEDGNLSLDEMRTKRQSSKGAASDVETMETDAVEISAERLKLFKASLLKLYK